MTNTDTLPLAKSAPITRLAHAVVLAWGWKRAAIAFGAGAVSVAGLAPVDAWPLLFLTFPILVWLVDGAGAGTRGGIVSAAFAGWWFGFGYFLAGLYWVGNAFLVDAQIFGWMLPFAVTILPAGLALFTALGTALARLIWTRGAMRILALAVALTFSEWLRGHLLTGFPWNTFGYALTGPLAIAQAVSLVGVWGLTFLAVAIFSTPAALIDERVHTRRPWLPIVLGIGALTALAGYGMVRLWLAPTTFVDDVRLRIMQPNLQQDQKFNYSAKQAVIERYLALSDRATSSQSAGVQDVTHLIWPESAFPFFLTREPDALARIAALLPARTVLITGGIRAPDAGPGPKPNGLAYNSVYVIDHAGSILGIYDKVHLVPFGEFLPFQNFLEGLGIVQLTKLPGGFLAGDRRRPLTVPRAPSLLPLVCYEIIFPSDAVPRREQPGWLYEHFGRYVDRPFVAGNGQRPGWLLNLTNDGWFGASAGPYQHFQQAQVRAIEEGLPLVRAANTGISAVVDPLGRVIASLPLGTDGVLDARLPKPVAPTVYARTGDSIAGIVIGMALVWVFVARWRRRQS